MGTELNWKLPAIGMGGDRKNPGRGGEGDNSSTLTQLRTRYTFW